MAGPTRSTVTFLTDASGGVGGSQYAAATWNVPYGQVADIMDTHFTNVSQGGTTLALVQHNDTHIQMSADFPQTTPRATVPVTIRSAMDELLVAWCEVVGVSAGTFRSATVPTTLTAINTNLTTNSTALATAGTWVKRDANAATALGGLSINISTTAGGGIGITGIASQTGAYINIQTSAAAPVFSVLADLSTHVAGALVVTGAATFASTGAFTGAVTAPNFHGVADSVPGSGITGTITLSQVGDLLVTPGATLLQVQIATGYYVDPTNTTQFFPGSTTAGIGVIAAPAGGLFRWYAISLGASNTISVVAGASDGASSSAAPFGVFPSGNKQLAQVLVPSGATTILAANVKDCRLGGNSAVTVTGISSAATLATIGAPSTSGDTGGVSAQDILLGNASGTVNGITFTPLNTAGSNTPANTGLAALSTGLTGNGGGGTSDTTLDLMLVNYVGALLSGNPQNQLVISGSTVMAKAGSRLFINGHMKYNAADSNAVSAASAAGLRDVFADSTDNGGVGGNQFKLLLATRGSPFSTTQAANPNTNCRYIATFLWDGTNLRNASATGDLPDFSAFGTTSATQHRLQIGQAAVTGGVQSITNAGGAAVLSGLSLLIAPTRPTLYLIGGTFCPFNASAALQAVAQLCDSGADSASPAPAAGNLFGIPSGFEFKQAGGFADVAIPWTVRTYNPGRYAIGIAASTPTVSGAPSYTALRGSLVAIPYMA